MIQAYRQGVSVKHLGQRFGIHRVTVTALLRRQGTELRQSGLEPEAVPVAASLYRGGWSVAKLGARFGVDATTVWRVLRASGVVMRSRNERGN